VAIAWSRSTIRPLPRSDTAGRRVTPPRDDLLEVDVTDTLKRLVDVRLLESTEPARYRISDLIRLYAAELAYAQSRRSAAQHTKPSTSGHRQTA
jgi:hypothetical protein